MIHPRTVIALVCCGPISGSLFLRASLHWHNGDRILAGLYVILIVLFWLLLLDFAENDLTGIVPRLK